MKTKDFLKNHKACIKGAKWALSISADMVDIWNAMVEQGKYEWLMWTATRPGVFPDSVLRKLAYRVVRETPLADGRTVWDLLGDERSRIAVEVAERYADGKATEQELDDAYVAARAAAYDAAFAAYDAVCAAAFAAAYAAADDAADDAYEAAYDAADAAAYAAARAAYAAVRAPYAAAFADAGAAVRAADDAAYAAARDAADAAYDAAKAAQVRMIAELGNPFKERTGR